MNNSFANLDTMKNVHEPLKPAAAKIYQSIFPECRVENLREQGFKVHVLDKEFGIDTLLHTKSNQWFSIQEKYRSYNALTHHDFTQEVENGDKSLGEWFKLGAQLYFYGWGNPTNTKFLEWFILDIVMYKKIIEQKGGIYQVGKLQHNEKHGKAKFVSIDLALIQPAMLFTGTGSVFFERIDNKSFSEPKPIIKPFLNGEKQPCQNYRSDNNKITFCKCGATKYLCQNCKQYHHENGYDSCEFYTIIKQAA